MHETVEQLVLYGLVFALGMGVGQFLSFRKKGKVVALEVEAKDVWKQVGKTTAYILVVIVFLGTVLNSLMFTYDQRQCNREMVETIRYRAQITVDDSKLNDARADALKDLVDDVIASTAIVDEYERGQFIRGSFTEYQAFIDRLNIEKDENEKKRQERPYPRC